METTIDLQHLTPVARLLIPYYEEKYKIKISSNLITYSKEISTLKQKIQERITAIQASPVEFTRFLQKSFDAPPETLWGIREGPVYENLLRVIPRKYLSTKDDKYIIACPLTEDELQECCNSFAHDLQGNPEKQTIIEKYMQDLRAIVAPLKDDQLEDLYRTISHELLENKKLQSLSSLLERYVIELCLIEINFSFLDNITLKQELEQPRVNNRSIGCLFYCDINMDQASDISHTELFLAKDNKICMPIDYFRVHSADIIYYKIPQPLENKMCPLPVRVYECNLLNLLYIKALLKNDGKFLKESIFFEKYNSKGEIERFFVPHPEVLKYSYSNKYNEYILSLTSNGLFYHEQKAYKNPSIGEMLLESIKNIEKLKSDDPKAITEEIEEILKANEILLEELPSINEKFITYYKIVTDYRKKIAFEHWGIELYDPPAYKRLTTCEKAKERAKLALGLENNSDQNIYFRTEISEDLAETSLVTTSEAIKEEKPTRLVQGPKVVEVNTLEHSYYQ